MALSPTAPIQRHRNGWNWLFSVITKPTAERPLSGDKRASKWGRSALPEMGSGKPHQSDVSGLLTLYPPMAGSG